MNNLILIAGLVFTLASAGCESEPTKNSILGTENIDSSTKAYRLLKHKMISQGKEKEKLLYLFISSNEGMDYIKINFPKYISTNLDYKDIKLCAFDEISKESIPTCTNKLSSKIKINNLDLKLTPNETLFSKVDYVLIMKISDQNLNGVYQMNLLSGKLKEDAEDKYLGSWRIKI